MRLALAPPGSPNGTPMTAACSTRSGWRRTRKSQDLSTSGARPMRPRIGRGRRSLTSSRASGSLRHPSLASPACVERREWGQKQSADVFYDARKKNDHGLPHDPFKAIVAPRPIGWITSISAAGEINLAPYAWFNGVPSSPPMVMVSSEQRKDPLAFIEETKEFVCTFATYELREQVNQ